MKKGLFKATSARVEKYLSEMDIASTAMEVAEFLGVANTTAYEILQLMEIFGTVQKVKRGRRQYYLPKGVYDDEQISAMLPPKKVKPKSRRRSIFDAPRISKSSVKQSFLEEQLSTMRAQVSSVEVPSALAVIGLQQEMIEKEIPTEELPRELEVDLRVEKRKFETPIMNKPFATIQYLPKDVRRLTLGQTKYLHEELKFLEGYDRIESLKTVFARLSALEKHKYGRILYFSMGMNSWDYVQKVTIDPYISDFMVLPAIEVKRWSSWKDFMRGLKEPIIRYGKDQYDKIIDQFLENDHKLVEITVENRKANYLNLILNKRIGERGLGEQVKVSFVSDWVYLEKVE